MNISETMQLKDNINNAMDDICKLMSQILIVHMLFSCIDGEDEFLNEKIVKKMLYTIIAMAVYHFILKKLIVVKQ